MRVMTRKLGVRVFDAEAVALVQRLQRSSGLPMTRVVDEVTAELLGEAVDADLPPAWWTGDVAPSDPEYVVVAGGFSLDEAGVRRLQGSHEITPTGVIDEATAKVIDRRA